MEGRRRRRLPGPEGSIFRGGGSLARVEEVQLAPALAALGALAWGGVELGLRARTPLARRLRGGPEDAGTTRLTATAVAIGFVGPWLARLLAPPPAGPGVLSIAVAAFALVVGLGLRVRAMRALGPAFTRTLTEGGRTLVECGPYRVVRHPGYLAALLVLPAHAFLAAGRPLALAAVLALLGAAYARRIPVEEALLARRFGAAWTAYAGRTARLVPRLRPRWP